MHLSIQKDYVLKTATLLVESSLSLAGLRDRNCKADVLPITINSTHKFYIPKLRVSRGHGGTL